MRQFIWIYGRIWLAMIAPFVRFQRDGFKQNSITPPAVLIVNHLSFFDTFCMALLPFSNVAFAVRAWPFKMLWYTAFMRIAKYLDVESMSWGQIVRSAERTFSKGGFLLFFPEGHRSRSVKLQRFFTGAFKLAVHTGVPIVPLCITGTESLLPPGRWWLEPTRIHFRALTPIDPKSFSGPNAHRELSKTVKKLMAESIAAMNT